MESGHSDDRGEHDEPRDASPPPRLRDYGHVLRVAAVFTFLVLSFLIWRAWMVPDDFGVVRPLSRRSADRDCLAHAGLRRAGAVRLVPRADTARSAREPPRHHLL